MRFRKKSCQKSVGKIQAVRKTEAACACLLLCSLLLTACGDNGKSADTDGATSSSAAKEAGGTASSEDSYTASDAEESEAFDEASRTAKTGETEATEPSYTVWAAYWDLEGVKEQIDSFFGEIKNVSYFEAYFVGEDEIDVPEELTEFYEETNAGYKEKGIACYLSVVNDLQLSDGSFSNKDVDFLNRVLASKDSRKAHAETIVNLALSLGFDGVEMDYENLGDNGALWDNYMAFIDTLYARCQEEDLSLRVLLEPNVDTAAVDWVTGPVYSIMCYNLYGSFGEETGPKANQDFLTQMEEKMAAVPGKADFALANGGYDWSSDGSCAEVTTARAQSLAAAYGAKEKTDKSSAKYFTYKAEDGTKHEVWYGDDSTVQTWADYLAESGNTDFSLWRLGE